MLSIRIGQSDDIDSRDAILDILSQVQKESSLLQPQAGLLFCSTEYEPQVLMEEIYKIYPDLKLIGTTSSGQISSTLHYREDSVLLVLFASDTIEMSVGIGRNVSQDPYRASQLAVDFAKSKLSSKPSLCITTPESLTVSGVTVLHGLQSVLGKNFPIFGGSSSVLNFDRQTQQFYNGEVLSDSVPVLLFSGEVLHSFGVQSGFSPVGVKRTVTKATANIVYELDHQPILNFYQKYIGDISLISPEYPLAVFEKDEENYYLRTPQKYIHEERAVHFSGDIPVGSQVQFADGSRQLLLSSTKKAIQSALESYPGDSPSCSFVVSCATRQTILGTKSKEEIEELSAVSPPGCQTFGLYVFGEITPLLPEQESKYLNASFLTLVIGTK